ncbi:MAG: outer membrane protein transport protein [Alphaproteobacteria bacterium]|nr:outer membrane protein transport protein [Alphaproteobacteria bacterium]
MNKIKNGSPNALRLLLISALSTVNSTLCSPPLMANGALPYCMGAKMCQMGGAGVAIPLDSTSGNVNPALMANVGRDAALDPLVVFQKEHVDTSRTQLTKGTPLPPRTGPVTNRIKAYGAAYSGFNYDINPEWSLGISTAGGGNNARYNRSIVSPGLSAPRKLESMAALASQILAYKPGCDQAYGLSLIVGYLQMKNNLTQFPSGIVTKGNDRTDHVWGIGGRIGGQWNVSQFLSLGAAASTPTFFQKLKKYSDVIKHSPRLPAIVTGGIALHVRNDTDVLFDLEGLFWKASPFTGKKPPIGQGWRNALVFKFGVQHKVIPDVQVRLGYNYGRTPVRKKYVLFNALDEVITINEHVLSTGFTYDLNPAMSFDLGGAILFNKKITDNGKGPAGLAAKGLRVEARALMVSLGFNLKY